MFSKYHIFGKLPNILQVSISVSVCVCWVIYIWVNYKVGSYPLYHMSSWYLTFQLCQFGL